MNALDDCNHNPIASFVCEECADEALTAAQEREAKLKATTDSLQAEIERLKRCIADDGTTQLSVTESTRILSEESFRVKADNAKLRGVVERLRRFSNHTKKCEDHPTGKCICGFQAVLAESADTLGGGE